MLLYVEFISRRPGISLQEFHERAGRAQGTWAGSYGEDVMLLNAGRTWRIGPEPEYLCVWYSPGHGLTRIDDWERLFSDSRERERHAEFEAVARIDRAGCYEPAGQPYRAVGGRYLVEWLSCDGADGEMLASAFAARTGRHPELQLHCLASPLGTLTPNQRGFAVWGLPSWGAAEALVRDPPNPASGIAIADASLLAEFGHEQL